MARDAAALANRLRAKFPKVILLRPEDLRWGEGELEPLVDGMRDQRRDSFTPGFFSPAFLILHLLIFPTRAKVNRGENIFMSATVWKGHIAFGLVSFPVKLHAAARTQSISFHQLHQCDHARIKQVLYCQAEDRPVSRTELVKGFEYEQDRYVVVAERELDQLV